MRFVLGVAGQANAGKDSFADYLINYHGWKGKLAFATNLKKMCSTIFNLSNFQVSDQEGKKEKFVQPVIFTQSHLNGILVWMCRTHRDKAIFSSVAEKKIINEKLKSLLGLELESPRKILQLVGTDVCRTVFSDYHLDVVFDSIPDEGCWVITDVRFPNEAEAIASRVGGKIIRLERPVPGLSADVYKHASEFALKDWDNYLSLIINDGDSLKSLHNKIDQFLEDNNLCRSEI